MYRLFRDGSHSGTFKTKKLAKIYIARWEENYYTHTGHAMDYKPCWTFQKIV